MLLSSARFLIFRSKHSNAKHSTLQYFHTMKFKKNIKLKLRLRNDQNLRTHAVNALFFDFTCCILIIVFKINIIKRDSKREWCECDCIGFCVLYLFRN